MAARTSNESPEPTTSKDAAIASVLAELALAGLVWKSEAEDGAIRYGLTDAGAPVACQMAMSSGQHAVVLMGIFMQGRGAKS